MSTFSPHPFIPYPNGRTLGCVKCGRTENSPMHTGREQATVKTQKPPCAAAARTRRKPTRPVRP